MATQSYYPGGEYESYHRPLHRSMSTAAYYDRSQPYGYYEQPRQDLRAEYGGRPVTRAMIQELDVDPGPGSSRRRIAVACSRCRRRKIKCSGDPGDGSGCQACRASGTDVSACNFNRVGSTTLPLSTGVEAYPQASSAVSAPAGGPYAAESASSSGWNHGNYLNSRPSLPTLHTRSSWMDNYDTYENSPVDYTYQSASYPHQDSFASSFGSAENYRSWGTTAPLSAPVTASYYEPQQPACSFGSLHAPSYTAPPSSRLAADTLSPLNMTSLHSSLPIQTAQERRLPVPYTIQYPTTTYPTLQLPEVRPLGSYSEPRAPTHGIHSRTAMPWSMDSTAGSTRTASMSRYGEPINGLPPVQSFRRQISVAPISEPVLGYQFGLPNLPSTGSPDASPTSGPTISEYHNAGTASISASAASMPPPTNFRYAATYPPPSAPGTEDRPTTSTSTSGSRETAAASLYSFSTDTSERPATSDSDQASSSTASTGSGSVYVPPRQSQHQAQYGSGIETVRRQTSFDQ